MRAWRGPRRRLCVAIGALCLLAPSAAAASEPTYTLAPGSPLASPAIVGSGLAFSPSGELLADGTAMFSVGPSGALTPVGGSAPDPSAHAVAFSPSGTLLAAPNEGSDTISMFSVGSSGALTAALGSPFALGAQPGSVAFSPSGELLEVSAGESLYMFSVGASGALTPVVGSPYSVKGAVGHAAFSLTGGLLSVPDSGGVSMFSVGLLGALSEVHGSPFAASGVPGEDAAFGEGGNALTVSGASGGGVLTTTYSVASSGVLTAVGGGTVSHGPPSPVAFSPAGGQIATTGMDDSVMFLHSIGPSGALGPGQSLENSDPVGSIAISASGLIATDSNGLAVFVPSSASSSTNWVGAFGSDGYDLAGWDGQSDVSDLPNASVSLVQGSRVVWAANTSDVRALTSPDGLTRTAAGYYDPTELQVKLTFRTAYTGNLRLYAVDWAKGGGKEHEFVTVGSSGSVLFDDNPDMGSQGFNDGQWAIFPVSEPAGASVTITVEGGGSSGAVLSGIFLGDAGAPPAVAVSSSPQGSWTGVVGSAGYDLGGWDGSSDVSDLPGVGVGLVQGSRYVWAASTSDVRALQSPDGLTRDASTYTNHTQIRLALKFGSAYTGDLHLYALDWDKQGRRETISVDGQTADLSSDFSNGAWVVFPISVAAGETVSIVVDRTAGINAVLSGIFLGDAGAPPAVAVSSSPQGSWTGVVGSAGYDLGGWDGSSDVSDLPGVGVGLVQGSRYVWAASTSDVRALQSPDGLTRDASTYTNHTQIRLALKFSSAYTGDLHLYALDWDKQGRRETISVDGQTADLSSDFSNGAWVVVPDLGRRRGNGFDRRRSHRRRQRGAVGDLPR